MADPTLADVAGEAGVSLSTASRALREGHAVHNETRARVRAAARKLGYEPNHLARSLRTRSSRLVGVVVPDIAIDFYARTVKAAQDALDRAGYQVLVVNTEREPEREAAALRTLAAHQVEGVLLAASGEAPQLPSVPVVSFDNILDAPGVARVALANRDGIGLLVDHLVARHRQRRVAYVGGPPMLTSGIERLDGFRHAVAAAGLDCPDEYVRVGDPAWSAASGAEATAALLALPTPPTAIVAASDTLALGALEALRAAGARVPDDVALVSFDDPYFGDLLDPPLTALSRAERELGDLAASLLLAALEGTGGPPGETRVPVRLIVRRSCGCWPPATLLREPRLGA
jgi:LacI family transcriptional regulator